MKSENKNYILFCISILLIVIFRDYTGVRGLAVGSIIFLIYFNLFKKDVALAYALCMVVVSNPFMCIQPYALGLSKNMAFTDIFFYLSFLSIFSPQIKERRVDINLKRILPILILFVLYQFLVSFLLKAAPDNLREIIRLVYRSLPTYLGIFLFIPSYIIFKIDGEKLITALGLATFIFTFALFLNNYTSIELFHLKTEFRNGVYRIHIIQSHTFYLVTFIAIGAFSFYGIRKKHIPLYLGGFGAMTVPFYGMYRLEMFTMFATIILVAFLVSKYLHRNFIGFTRLFIALMAMAAIVLVLVPQTYYSLSDLYVNTFHELLGTGEVEKGTTQTRTEHELPLHLGMIRENPILGNGWDPRWFRDTWTDNDWGLSDIPLTATLAMYGWLGILIYYSRYLFILPLSKYILSAIGKEKDKIKKNGFHYIVIIAIRSYFIAGLSFRLFYISYELTIATVYTSFGAFLGIYFASIYMIEHQNDRKVSQSVLGKIKEI